MKKTSALYLLVIILFCSCSKSDSPYINIPKQKVYTYNYKASTNIEINSNTDWTISSNASWCRPEESKGNGNANVIIFVDKNDSGVEREAMLYINIGTEFKTITVTQNKEAVGDQYIIPLIFHVLYNDINSKTQYVEEGHIGDLIEDVSKLFNEKINMNVTFIAATEDENGNELEEPGVNRIKVDNHIFDYNAFMGEGFNFGIMTTWNLNKYINVFLYEFHPEKNGDVIGASHIPYTIESCHLDGLNIGDAYIDIDKPLHYAHCISINNKRIYTIGDPNGKSNRDIITTMTHELGHYLGLFHSFSTNHIPETDYCDDTPDYDRSKYAKWVNLLDKNTSHSLETLSQRVSTDGVKFTSTNIMDYIYGYSDEFTEDQRSRVRHVLMYSPMIPGPKLDRDATRSKTSVFPPIRISD